MSAMEAVWPTDRFLLLPGGMMFTWCDMIIFTWYWHQFCLFFHLVCIVCVEVGNNITGVDSIDVQIVVVIVIVVDVVVNIENKSEHLNILGKIKHVMHPMVSLSRVVITNMFSCHTFYKVAQCIVFDIQM